MSTTIPTWIRLVWVAGLLLVVAVHLCCLLPARGRARWWHAAHLLIAAGMIDHFWPSSSMPIGSRAGAMVFGFAAAGSVLVLGASLVRQGRDTPLAAITAVDLIAMAFTFSLPGGGSVAVTLLLGGWLVLEAFAWACGELSGLAHTPLANPATRTPAGGARLLRGRPGPLIPLSLAFTNIAMALVLLGAQFGTDAPMPGLTDLPANMPANMPGM